jgi:hypothetical protein
MSQANKVYVGPISVGPGNSGIDSQPMNANVSGYMIAPDNVTVTSTGVSANFSYEDSINKVREYLVAALQADYPDVNMDVTFL